MSQMLALTYIISLLPLTQMEKQNIFDCTTRVNYVEQKKLQNCIDKVLKEKSDIIITYTGRDGLKCGFMPFKIDSKYFYSHKEHDHDSCPIKPRHYKDFLSNKKFW